jgi:putative ABC transport system permease protein
MELGVDMAALKNSRFAVRSSIYLVGTSVFDTLCTASGDVYPVLVDGTTLTWGLQIKTGDTLRYETGAGKTVYLLLATVLHNSVFQGNILMDKRLFSHLWPEITGSEIILFKVKETEVETTQRLVSQALSEYGVRGIPTAGRLKAFDSVSDTYLTIFLTLVELGLLIGIVNFIVVVWKDLASREEQIALYRSLGFPNRRIVRLTALVSATILVATVWTFYRTIGRKASESCRPLTPKFILLRIFLQAPPTRKFS